MQCSELLASSGGKLEVLDFVFSSNSCKPVAKFTLADDLIVDAIVKVNSPSQPPFAAYIREGYGLPYRLQQLQDCLNHVHQALYALNRLNQPSTEVKVLREILSSLKKAILLLANNSQSNISALSDEKVNSHLVV